MTDGPHRVDRLWPDPALDIGLDEAMELFELPDPPRGRPLVAVNMITSIDGRAQIEGTAEGLGSRADRRLMRLYRSRFDAVASGSGTLRQAGAWLRVGRDLEARRTAEGRPPNPTGVVIAGSDPVPTDARWFSGDERRILIVGRHNPMEDVPEGTELVRASDARPSPRWILSTLASRGIRTLLLEGGPHLNAAFFAAGLIDELYWTVGAKLLATDALPMIANAPGAGEPRPAHLASILRHDDELFLRYRLAAGG
jgi:riboflavin biosynthesis pyrimidine reductase